MDTQVLSALNAIPVSELDRADWIKVGMALKEAGFPCSVWDEWSRNDTRYHAGECEKKWASFQGSGTPVTAASIVQMAKDHGWNAGPDMNAALGWNDTIEYDGDISTPNSTFNGVEELKKYLSALFGPDDIVGYVTSDVWKTEEGKWAPAKGVYHRKASDIIRSLDKYKDDLGATVGDWKRLLPEPTFPLRFSIHHL